jgi:NAD(P)-dependent dehydrogenase (short-subunit alcohol dehydrogenase family)
MPKSIAVFGVGPGLGEAVARRYVQGGYEVVLVARRREPLESLAEDLTGAGERPRMPSPPICPTPVRFLRSRIRCVPRSASLTRSTTRRPRIAVRRRG